LDEHWYAGFFAEEADGFILPINIFPFEVRDVSLTGAQVPAQLIEHLPLSVGLRRQNFLMLLKGNRPLLFEPDRRPIAFAESKSQLRRAIAHEGAAPRIHDLRHTHACRVLQRWQASRQGASGRVLILSRYLGHHHVRDTYW